MKAKNQKFTFKTQQELFAFKEEVEKYMGRYVPSYNLESLELTVSPFPKNYKKKQDAERKVQANREARGYSDYDEGQYDS